MYTLRQDEVKVLKQMRRENESAVAAQRELESSRAVERKNIVREHQREAQVRKAKEQARQRLIQRPMQCGRLYCAWLRCMHGCHLMPSVHVYATQEVALAHLKSKRETKRQALDDDALSHLNTYSSLAEEEQRLLDSLQKWTAVQDEAYGQLDGVLGSTGSHLGSRIGSRASSRPISRSFPPSPRTPASTAAVDAFPEEAEPIGADQLQ